MGHHADIRLRDSVAIIGAGIGALTAAAYLARAGLDVSVYEQHSVAGGYVSSFERDGFHAVGHYVFNPGGVPTAMITAWYIAREILEQRNAGSVKHIGPVSVLKK